MHKKTLLFAGAIIAIDQLTKWLAIIYLPVTKNTGIAFSVPISNWVMIIGSPFLLLFLWYGISKSIKMTHPLSHYALGFILGGAIGNYIDRIAHQGVIDFIDLGFFPSFNVADSAITVGVALLLIFYGRMKRAGA